MSLILRRHHKEESKTFEEVEADLSRQEEVVDYESHTVPELKELADERELDYKYDIKKANLIELLEK